MLFCCFEAFSGKFTENISFYSKYDYLRKEHRKTQKVCFSLRVWKGANPEENLDLFKQLFLIKPLKGGQILTKTVFLLKVSHIQLNYAFLLFWSILGEIHRELHFLVQKVTISEKSTEILRKFVFLNKFEKGKSRGKFRICLNNCFWSNQ